MTTGSGAPSDAAVQACAAYLEQCRPYFDPDVCEAEIRATMRRAALSIYYNARGIGGRFEAYYLALLKANVDNAAAGDMETFLFLRGLAEDLTQNGDALPEPLAEWWSENHDAEPPPRPRRGPAPARRHLRDMAIIHAVNIAHREHGFALTRNRATKDKAGPESAFSIVALALASIKLCMTEAAIEYVWYKDWTRHDPAGADFIYYSEAGN